MKFWKKLKLIGSVIVIVLGIFAFIVALLQAPAANHPAPGASTNGPSAPQQPFTQGL